MKKNGCRRGARRIRVEVPVHLEHASGITRDVSPSGVYFLATEDFTPGMPLRFVLDLDYVFPGTPVHLHCRGRVLRVEESGGKRGVAASISELWSAG